MAKKIPKIDDNDNVIGETTIPEARANGWRRRISRVFVFDGEGNQLLQKRSDTVVSSPGLWDQAAGGHIDLGESYREAAERELFEELGLSGYELEEIATSYRSYKMFEGIYKATVPQTVKINFDPEEVSEVTWMSMAEFEAMSESTPEMFPSGFLTAWKEFRDKLIQ